MQFLCYSREVVRLHHFQAWDHGWSYEGWGNTLIVSPAHLWSSFSKIPASKTLESGPHNSLFLSLVCDPDRLKGSIELGLSFSCSLNHEKSFIEHRIILFQIRWTNIWKMTLMEFSLTHFQTPKNWSDCRAILFLFMLVKLFELTFVWYRSILLRPRWTNYAKGML